MFLRLSSLRLDEKMKQRKIDVVVGFENGWTYWAYLFSTIFAVSKSIKLENSLISSVRRAVIMIQIY